MISNYNHVRRLVDAWKAMAKRPSDSVEGEAFTKALHDVLEADRTSVIRMDGPADISGIRKDIDDIVENWNEFRRGTYNPMDFYGAVSLGMFGVQLWLHEKEIPRLPLELEEPDVPKLGPQGRSLKLRLEANYCGDIFGTILDPGRFGASSSVYAVRKGKSFRMVPCPELDGSFRFAKGEDLPDLIARPKDGTLIWKSPGLGAILDAGRTKEEMARILSRDKESLLDLVPNLEQLWGGPDGGPNPRLAHDLRAEMARAAIRVVVSRTIGWWLFSLGGLGEGDRTNTFLAMDTLCRPAAKIWREACKEYFQMPVPVCYAERDAFRRHDGTPNFWDKTADAIAEELTKTWSEKDKGEGKC